jgi:hypothetical protein
VLIPRPSQTFALSGFGWRGFCFQQPNLTEKGQQLRDRVPGTASVRSMNHTMQETITANADPRGSVIVRVVGVLQRVHLRGQ